MAIKKCKECNIDISSKAKVCPHCGVTRPGISAASNAKGCLGLILFCLIFAAVMVSCDDKESKLSPESSKVSDIQCQHSLSCLADKHIIYAGAICQSPIQKISKYSYEWTDGFATPRFSHYRWVSQSKGIITYIGDEIKLQNGFGAWAHYTYECDFDTAKQSVIDVRATQGRIQ
jgi:hypothetical protein